jgi:hypothetical protein
MKQTYVFEELDSATREYLISVRDAKGEGAPGIFVPTSSAFAGCGCIAGPIIIIFTLIATLTTWPKDLVHQEPGAIAFLQTAGLLLGGWLAIAGVRAMASKGSKTSAGNWLYVDSLYLYEACREQVTVTPIEDVSEANYTHNYNEGNYQNSVVRIAFDGAKPISVTINNEAKAEQFTAFLNYLAWARGSEGEGRGKLSPAKLGALAKYAVVHDTEPKDTEGNFDFDLVDLEIDEVPGEHTREGHAVPQILPYILIVLSAVAIYFTMWKVVNPPVRDEALFDAVTKYPEPGGLRAYLSDERNTRHRDEVQRLLDDIYARAITQVNRNGTDPKLREGMTRILDSLKGQLEPAVSLNVEEIGANDGADKRKEALRNGIVGTLKEHWVDEQDKDPKHPDYFTAEGGICGQLAQLMPPITPLPGVPAFTIPPTAIGLQLMSFAAKPEEATHAHFEISYEFVPTNNNRYQLRVKVAFRTTLDGDPVLTYEDTRGNFGKEDFQQQITQLKDRLVDGMVGNGAAGAQHQGKP